MGADGKIHNWSFSRLMLYERCAYAFKLKAIDRVPEPPREPGNPLERGNRVHKELELYVKEEGAFPREADQFQPPLDHLQKLYKARMVDVEHDWFFDENWEPCEKASLWLWVKLDVNVRVEDEHRLVVVDYKTGRMGYKVVEHGQQGQLYAGAAALRYPWAHEIDVEFWYTDEKAIRHRHYTREEALGYIGAFQKRVDLMYADRVYRPRPSALNCKYCAYGANVGNGACPYAYRN